MKKYRYLIVVLFLGLNVRSFAQLYMNPHSVAFANAYSTKARGANVIGWNPANLGLNDNPKFSMSFGAFPFVPIPAFQISNNSISPYWLDNKFFTGKYLTDKDKEDLLGYFPNEGLMLNPLLQMQILGISVGRWAVTIGTEFTGNLVLPKSLFHFAFYGNEFGKAVDLSDLDLEAQSVATIAVAHGRELGIPYLSDYCSQVTAGIAIKTLVGIGYAEFEQVNAQITTFEDKFVLEGDAVAKYGKGGFGMALDMGLSAVINEKMMANISLNNLLGSINWGIIEAEKVEYSYFTEIYSDEFDIADSLFEKGVKKDTSYSINELKSNYPGYLLLGFQYNIFENLNVFTTVKQHFNQDFASTYLPKISFAADFRPLKWLPIRAGIAFGGIEEFQWGIGTGLSFNHYSLDWGFSQIGGMFNNAKGFAFSLGQQITF
ncbi:MAG: hypothetical protein KAW56_10280 [Candidatus Marinimicrobia bacterium]|nr:hypothetical protein [Candidatus Neomarinimicrobiota bacterium]